MKLLTKPKPKPKSSSTSEAASEERAEPAGGATAAQVVGSVWLHRLVTAGLAGCLLAGPAALMVGMSTSAQVSALDQAAPAPTVSTDQSADQAAAAEFGTRVVVAWLRSSQTDPSPVAALITDVPVASLPRTPFTVSEAAMSSIRHAGAGTWTVTVAATIPDAKKHPQRRYFTVPVSVTAQPFGQPAQVAALTLPAAVAAPPVMEGARLAYGQDVPVDSEVGQAVSGFLGAYAAGQGDVARFLTPGVKITPVTPPLFTSIALGHIQVDQVPSDAPADGDRLHVLATVTGTTAPTQTLPMAYELTLRARAGRWEVSAVDPGPLRADAASASSAPPTAPTSVGTTTSTSTTSP